MTAFADMLDSYADSFEGSNYNWSNSAYLNKEDYQKKLRDVAVSLRNGVYDNNIAAKLDTIGIGAQLREYLLVTVRSWTMFQLRVLMKLCYLQRKRNQTLM